MFTPRQIAIILASRFAFYPLFAYIKRNFTERKTIAYEIQLYPLPPAGMSVEWLVG